VGYLVIVAKLPSCQDPGGIGCKAEAHYDAATKRGPWGYVCEACFKEHCWGLGTGRGQMLITAEEVKVVREAAEIARQLRNG